MSTFEIISILPGLTHIGRFTVPTSCMYMMYPSLHEPQSARFSTHVSTDTMQGLHHTPTGRLHSSIPRGFDHKNHSITTVNKLSCLVISPTVLWSALTEPPALITSVQSYILLCGCSKAGKMPLLVHWSRVPPIPYEDTILRLDAWLSVLLWRPYSRKLPTSRQAVDMHLACARIFKTASHIELERSTEC
jgi:hypothetical protein